MNLNIEAMKTQMILKMKMFSLLVVLLLGSVGLKASDTKNDKKAPDSKIEIENVLIEEAPLELKAWMVSESYWRFCCSKAEWDQIKKDLMTEEKGLTIESWMTNDKIWKLNEQKR